MVIVFNKAGGSQGRNTGVLFIYGREKMSSAKHPGFKGVQKKIEKEGYSKKEAGAILASKTRGASKATKEKNPNLKKVK